MEASTAGGDMPEEQRSRNTDSDPDESAIVASPQEALGEGLEKLSLTLGTILRAVEDTADHVCTLVEAHQSSLDFFKAWHDALRVKENQEESVEKDDSITDGKSTDIAPTQMKREHSDSDSQYSEIL